MTRSSTSHAWQDGDSVLHYRITGELGSGGQGVVYRAYDTKLKRTVALKFLPHDSQLDEVHRNRFLREAITVSALDHPNIGTVHALEETPAGETFIVMTCYEGQDLKARIRQQGRLPPLDAVGLAIQVARGLQAAHAAGIVHRDLKPSNMVLTPQGILKIIDFGLAKSEGASDLTEMGVRMGTIHYMSPEQAVGAATDHRTDLWALGVILFELLTGQLPFRGANAQATLYAIVNQPTPAMPGIAGSLQALVQRALAKDVGDRFQSAAEMLAALETIGNSVTDETAPLAATVSAPVSQRIDAPLLPPPSKNRWVPIAIAATIVAVAAASMAAWWSGSLGRLSHPPKYLAVLPFGAAGTDAAQQALASGWTNSLTEALKRYEAANPDLLVAPPSEVARISDVAAARKAFGVERVLIGQISAQGSQMRLTLNLFDAARQQPLGSASIDGTADGLASMNTRALEQVARMLELRDPGSPSPPPPEAYASWLRGVGFLERNRDPGSLEYAIEEFNKGLSVAPDPLLWAGLSQAYRLQYERTKDVEWLKSARDSVAKGIELDKNVAANYLSRGAIRNLEGDYKGAAEDFQSVLLLDARSDEAYRGLARAYDGLHLPDPAEETYKKAIAIRPGHWSGYNRLGGFYARQQRFQEAAEQYRKVIQLVPNSFEGHNNLGSMLARVGKTQEARAAFEESVRLTPNVPAYNNLGNLFLRQKSFAEASSAYEKALEIDNADYKLWANLAAAHLRTPGQRSGAMDAYQQAAKRAEALREQAPENATVLADLATYYAMMDKRSEPLTYITQALALAPAETNILAAAAETYELLGYRTQAVDFLVKALSGGYPWTDIAQAGAFEDLLKDSRYRDTFQEFRK